MNGPYQQWTQSLRAAEAVIKARKWKVRPLVIHPPAKAADIARVEKKLGSPLPNQVRDALLELSSKIVFGWSASPNEQAPFKHGGLGAALWDLKTIEAGREAIERWLDVYDGQDEFEEPHSRKMWDDHLAFATLPNGDLLTIDASKPGQPVRYFSHEIEGFHGAILALDFNTFFTEYTALACAGITHDDWFALCSKSGKKRLLKASAPLGKEWIAFLKGDPSTKVAPKFKADITPKAVSAVSEADKQLLAAAERGNMKMVDAALAAGANINCSARIMGRVMPSYTAIDFAAMKSNLALLEHLVAAGASVHTPESALSAALVHADTKTVAWLLAKGCHVESRSNDRESPLQTVLEAISASETRDEKRLLANLDALLTAGADPNACVAMPPPLGISALAVPTLLRHGADAKQANDGGFQPLHYVINKAHVVALVKAGSDPNAHSNHGGKSDPGRTPLQWLLTQDDTGLDVIEALIDAGADPRIKDTAGKWNAFQYCIKLEHMRALTKKGFKPNDVDADGNTVLINLLDFCMLEPTDVPKAITHLVQEKKVNVDAQNKRGDTALHMAAKLGYEAQVRALLKVGADKTLKNKKGELPVKLVPRGAENATVRKLLTVT